ncbi:aspartyl-phosphate phosphatase Spo0E family protein [Sporolactobacillus sp. THM7-4]|nr:aspartyl-phosphate phosphatase Spo0E family protein [Sporolactobacillus sp. THM7-4]
MSRQNKDISVQIERARQKLFEIEAKLGLQDQKVVKQSMVLDELINQYNSNRYAKMAKADIDFLNETVR